MTTPLSPDDIARLREQSQGLRKLAGFIGLAGIDHLLAAEAIDACLVEIERRGLKLAGIISFYQERDPDEEKDSVRLHREKMGWAVRARKAEAEIERLRNDHADMVRRNAVLRQRSDLPVDRLPAIAEYEAEIERLRAIVGEMK